VIQVQCIQAHPEAHEAIEVVELAAPDCPPTGVVVSVLARPINPADLLLLNGRHAYTPIYPSPVGIEGCGRVLAAGPGSRLRPGQLVAIPFGGTWREQMALSDDDVIPVAEGAEVEQVAMLSVNPFTAAGLLEGMPPAGAVLMNAGSSAVSGLVLDLARQRSIPVVAAVRDLAQAPGLLARGAAAVVQDGPRAVAPAPYLRGLDAVAGQASGWLFEALAEGATLVVYGLLSDNEVHLPASGLVFRDVQVRGYSRLRVLRSMAPSRRAEVAAELVALVERGLLRTEVEARYPLSEAREALRHQARPGRRGKILLCSG
jgi:mitochondrial enoyl-[acyl-carrier protein] reductase / trans-2-enoyl-CoA reductase